MKKLNRLLAMALAVSLCFGMLATPAFADEPAEPETEIQDVAADPVTKETSDDETSDEETSDDETSDEETSDDETSDEETSDDETSDDETSDDETSDEEPSDDETSDEEPSNEEPSDEEAPEEGSVKTDEVLEESKDQLPEPPEGYEKQEDGSYTKPGSSETTTNTSEDKVDGTTTTTLTETTKNVTYKYEIKEVKDEETGALLGYEAVTYILTDYVTNTTTTEEKTETNQLEVDTTATLKVENSGFPLTLNAGMTGLKVTHWSVKDGVLKDGETFTVEVKPASPTKILTLTFKTTKIEEVDGVKVKTVTTTTYTPQYTTIGTPKLSGFKVSSCAETTTTTTVTESTETNSDPVRIANQTLLTVEQDADGVITYKAPVANDSSVEKLRPVTPDVDALYSKNLLNPENTEPIEVDSDFIFRFLGESALRSAIRLNPYGKGDFDGVSFNSPISLYILRDEDGNAFYAYCADQEVDAVVGTDYSLGNLGDGKNLTAETASQVQAVALNGYWGTTEGFGSLESIKETLRKALESGEITGVTEAQIALLTDGAAMAATQAAIWALMNENVINTDDPINSRWSWKPNGTGSAATNGTAQNAEPAALAFYRYLLTQAQTPEDAKPATDIIRADDLKEVKIDVIDVSKEATVDSKAVYNANVSFILDVEPDRMNSDNLVVTLIDAKTGVQIGEPYRLLDARQEDGEGKTYTLKNVELPNGTTVTLKLSGTQNVERNAYLILADAGYEMSQTFVGVMEGDYNVNLSMNVHFSINDITVEPDDPTPPTPPTPPTLPEDPDTPTPPEDPSNPTPPGAPDNPRPSTPPRTPVSSVEVDDPDVPLAPEPEIELDDPDVPLAPEPEIELDDPDVPLAPEPEIELDDPEVPLTPEPEIELDDPDVPLADVPRTGDNSHIWGIFAAVSGMGFIWLFLEDKKNKNAVK